MNALKPEPYEGFGLSFLFASFSLDSKEKEVYNTCYELKQEAAIRQAYFISSPYAMPTLQEFLTSLQRNLKIYPHYLSTN